MASQTLWINNLSGSINQKSPGLLADNESEIMINISQAQLGNWAHRLGTERYLDSVSASAPVRGLGSFFKDNGVKYLHMVSGGNLYVNGVGSWTAQATSEWDTSSEIDMVNYLGRHYMASSTAGEMVRYFTETGGSTYLKLFSTTVSNSSTGTTLVASTSVFNSAMVGMTVFNTTDATSATITAYTSATQVTVDETIGDDWDGDNIEMRIDGKYLAVNGAYMMVVGNSLSKRRAYFTNVADEVISVDTDYFNTSQVPTGVVSFGNGRPFVIFTEDNYLVVDPATIYTDEVQGYGAVSHRSIQVVKGNVIFLDRKGFYMLGANMSTPIDISESLKNDLLGNALFNKIDPDNLSVVASGVIDDRYYCAVRDLSATVRGQTIESCVFEFDTAQNSWRVHTFTTNDLANCFSQFTDSTGTFLYGGSFSSGTVYKMEVVGTYTDDNTSGTGQNVDALIQTKHYEFFDKSTGATNMKNVKRLHFKYYAAGAVTIKYALDGSETYSSLTTLPTATTNRWTWEYIDLGEECKSISLQINSTDFFIIYAIGFEIESQAETGIRGR